MNIYFAGSIRGGRVDANLYSKLITLLESKGIVLTEHVGNSMLSKEGEKNLKDNDIFDRDIAWIHSAHVLIAEVTQPSLGVGYELCLAEQRAIPILCLYRQIPGKNISAMIKGNKYLTCKKYKNFTEIKKITDQFFNSILI